ncbi:MAG: type II secretion system major pseudopilin GspG [Sphingomonadales bacterium]
MHRRISRNDGFTLIELLIVLVILGLLAGLAAPRIIKYLGSAKSDVARLQIDSLGASLDLFTLDIGRYPATEEGLQALVEAPAGLDGWHGPYTKGTTVPLDPWGNDYVYQYPGENKIYDLRSLGADNSEGGEGENQDIANE